MRSLLITGGAGFIGTNFVKYWVSKYPDDKVVVLDALTYAGSTDGLIDEIEHGRIEFVKADICDEPRVAAILADCAVDTIVHFAAESHVDRSISGPDAFIRTNVVGTHSLLKVAKHAWLDSPKHVVDHRFHHISTDEVYGSLSPDDPPFSELTPYAPNSPYSASKAGSDFLVRAYAETYGLKATTTNCSNNYGPYQYPEKLIPLVISNALTGRDLPVYGDGSNIRDWLHVDDHCRGIEAVLARGAAGETYNIGGNCERTNLDIVKTVCRVIDQRFSVDETLRTHYPDAAAANGRRTEDTIRFVTDRPGHDWRYAIDASKIRDTLDFMPRVALEQGIGELIDWMLAHRSWWAGRAKD